MKYRWYQHDLNIFYNSKERIKSFFFAVIFIIGHSKKKISMMIGSYQTNQSKKTR